MSVSRFRGLWPATCSSILLAPTLVRRHPVAYFVSSFICLDETKINHNSLWRLRGFFLCSNHFPFSRASASCVHETPCWLLPLMSDLSGSVTRQPIKHNTVWQLFKSQKVTITLITMNHCTLEKQQHEATNVELADDESGTEFQVRY